MALRVNYLDGTVLVDVLESVKGRAVKQGPDQFGLVAGHGVGIDHGIERLDGRTILATGHSAVHGKNCAYEQAAQVSLFYFGICHYLGCRLTDSGAVASKYGSR